MENWYKEYLKISSAENEEVERQNWEDLEVRMDLGLNAYGTQVDGRNKEFKTENNYAF